jgi:hypothetical protein
MRLFLEKRPNRKVSKHDLAAHFTDSNKSILYYHLKVLLEEHFIRRISAGHYELDPKYQSPEAVRAAVEEHAKNNPPPIIQNGTPFRASEPVLTLVENPRTIAYLGNLFGTSILERMRSALFTESEIEFVTGLLRSQYHVTPEIIEAQRNGKH